MPPLIFALAQMNPVVGDIAGNAAKIMTCYREAKAHGADVVMCPELALAGYPPEDLALMPAFAHRCMQAVLAMQHETLSGPALIVGSLWHDRGDVYNAAVVIADGAVLHVQPKTQLPNYGIFDEQRLFRAGSGPKAFAWRGVTIGLLVCEDVWNPVLSEELKRQGAQLLLVINASPFEAGKLQQRREGAKAAVQAAGLPLVYVNMVGGQDDIVFDGGSFAMAADGRMCAQLPEFRECIGYVRYPLAPGDMEKPLAPEAALWQAMTLGLGDYVRKNGFSGVVLGLSGGIDSAVSAAAAVDALGAAHVKGVLMPSPYSSPESVEDALESAALLGIETMQVPIMPGMAAFDTLFSPLFGDDGWMENPAVGGNVQARLRGMVLMGISNRFGWMVLSTGNKSELAVGYSTLYGDACGGYNVLKDLYKTQVYALARWRNTQARVIPPRSISKAPSAELAPGQTDQDQLPPYELLDAILARHIEGRQGAAELVAAGYEAGMVANILRWVRQSEYKRRQSCPGVRLSAMLFGRDRRYPLTNKF
jgi:NAD+ synthase